MITVCRFGVSASLVFPSSNYTVFSTVCLREFKLGLKSNLRALASLSHRLSVIGRVTGALRLSAGLLLMS
jgi:hypothetical protein